MLVSAEKRKPHERMKWKWQKHVKNYSNYLISRTNIAIWKKNTTTLIHRGYDFLLYKIPKHLQNIFLRINMSLLRSQV